MPQAHGKKDNKSVDVHRSREEGQPPSSDAARKRQTEHLLQDGLTAASNCEQSKQRCNELNCAELQRNQPYSCQETERSGKRLNDAIEPTTR